MRRCSAARACGRRQTRRRRSPSLGMPSAARVSAASAAGATWRSGSTQTSSGNSASSCQRASAGRVGVAIGDLVVDLREPEPRRDTRGGSRSRAPACSAGSRPRVRASAPSGRRGGRGRRPRSPPPPRDRRAPRAGTNSSTAAFHSAVIASAVSGRRERVRADGEAAGVVRGHTGSSSLPITSVAEIGGEVADAQHGSSASPR